MKKRKRYQDSHDVCLLYPRGCYTSEEPWETDAREYTEIVMRLEICSPRAFNKLCKDFPWLLDLSSEEKGTAECCYTYQEIKHLVPRLKPLYEKLIMAGVEFD